MTVWEELHELLDRYDADAEFDVASEAAWSGQLRMTLTNPEGEPSRSIAFYAVGGGSPEDVARRVIDDFKRWLADSATEPLPVPEWMR